METVNLGIKKWSEGLLGILHLNKAHGSGGCGDGGGGDDEFPTTTNE